MKRWQKIVLSIAALFAVPAIAVAATIQSGNTYTLASGETVDGALYVGAGTVNVDGTVNGDVVVAGGTVTISGTVNGDILASGGTLSVTGTVTEDVRVAGGQITIATTVPGDVNAVGGTITLDEAAVVQGDMLVAGGEQELRGTVNGELRAAGGKIVLAGTVQGDVEAYVGELSLLDSAVIGGDLSYSSDREASIADGASIAGAINFEKTTYNMTFGLLGATIIGWVIKFIALLVAALVFATAFRSYTAQIVQRGRMQLGKQFVIGLLVLVVTPVVFGILLATIIGSMVGIILFAIYFLLLLLAVVYGGIIFGALMMRFLKKDYPEHGDWVSALLGVLVLQLIGLIPIAGWLVVLFFFILALGSLSSQKWMSVRGNRA